MWRDDGVPGTVYLLHFETPYRHARHYLGWTTNLHERLAAHRAGNGARLMEIVTAAGIEWRLVCTWPGTRAQERHMKANGGLARCCPVCTPTDAQRRFKTAAVLQ